MSRTRAAEPFLDRLLLQPAEVSNPDLRFTKSLYFFVLLSTALAEAALAFFGIVFGHPESVVLHGVLALAAAGSLALFRDRFDRWVWAVGFWFLAWASSAFSLVMGIGVGALLWHFFLPAAFLLLLGEKWGLIALGADLLLALVHLLFFLERFGNLFGPDRFPASAWVLGAWEGAAIALFFLFFVFLRLIKQALAAYQAEKGQTLDLLTQTKNSADQWADQARFLETLTDLIPFPLFQKGTDGRFLSANASFRVVFDVQKDQIAGKTNEDFLRPENAKTLAKIELEVLARDSMAVEETTLIHADGQPHSFVVYLMPLVDGTQSPLGSIGVLIDITDRKHREEKLVSLNNTKDQLFSIISHDLRGPVGKLKQLLDIYMDDPGIFDKATWDQVFHDMRRSADSLFQLLENLLSWARTQQDHPNIHYESVTLEPIVGDIFAVLKLLATEKRVTLETDIHLAGGLLTDRHVLSTILRNLVHNALKFTMPGGKIIVSAEESLDDLWIEVRDNGIGMAPATLHRIFDKRERVTTFGTGKEKGQGIGLGLCQDLATSLGAHLVATSKIGEGTTIRLHLPTPEL